MSFILTKVITFLMMPMGIILIGLTVIFIKNDKRTTKWVSGGVFLYIFLITNTLLMNFLIRKWEIPPKKISEIEKHDIGIVLTGGIINEGKTPIENIYLDTSADRIFQALNLYKNHKINKILISGGVPLKVGNQFIYEAVQAANYLIISGVKKEDILLELSSKNTYENAVQTSKILKKQFSNQKYLLITSAYHLRRADGLFRKLNIHCSLWGSNYLSYDSKVQFLDLLPSEEGLFSAKLVIKEWIGYAVYRIAGKI